MTKINIRNMYLSVKQEQLNTQYANNYKILQNTYE